MAALTEHVALQKVLNMMVFDMLRGLITSKDVRDVAHKDGYIQAINDLNAHINKCVALKKTRKTD